MSLFYEIFTDSLVFISVILPILYALRYKNSDKAYKLFTWYLFLVAVIQSFMMVYAINEWNNLFMSHFYFIGQFVILSFFYKELLAKKWILWVLFFVLVCLAVQYIYNPSIFFLFNQYGMSITQTIIVVYAFLYFLKSLTIKGAYLYLNTGVLFYLITSVLYYASYNLFLELYMESQSLEYIFWLHLFLYLIFQIFIFIEWHRNYRIKKMDEYHSSK